MLKKNSKEINFFNTKIDSGFNSDFKLLKKKLVNTSLKLYIVIFILFILYISISYIKISYDYKKIEANTDILGQNIDYDIDLKEILLKQKLIQNFLNEFNNSKKFSIKIIEEMIALKPKSVTIKEMSLIDESINLKCISNNSNDAILYISKLRKSDLFSNVLYTGGDFSFIDNTFIFEINIDVYNSREVNINE